MCFSCIFIFPGIRGDMCTDVSRPYFGYWTKNDFLEKNDFSRVCERERERARKRERHTLTTAFLLGLAFSAFLTMISSSTSLQVLLNNISYKKQGEDNDRSTRLSPEATSRTSDTRINPSCYITGFQIEPSRNGVTLKRPVINAESSYAALPDPPIYNRLILTSRFL